LLEVVIHKFEDGAFFSELLLEQNGEGVPNRFPHTQTAVALAIRTHSPIYTTRGNHAELWRSCFDERSTTSSSESSTSEESGEEELSELRLDTLKDRLKAAVKEEDYELATRLRDEINRRENRS